MEGLQTDGANVEVPSPKPNQTKTLKIELPYDPATPYGYPNKSLGSNSLVYT